MNYTFEVTFLGALRQIEVDDGLEDNYTISLESYTSLEVNVSVNPFNTFLINGIRFNFGYLYLGRHI